MTRPLFTPDELDPLYAPVKVNPTVTEADKPRLGRSQKAIIEMLRTGRKRIWN